MGTFFYHVIVNGLSVEDVVQNSFWYKETEIGIDEPTEAMMNTVLDRWIAQVQPEWLSVHLPSYSIVDLTCVPYKSDGSLGDVLPVTRVVGEAGEATGAQGGAGGTAILAFALGTRTQLAAGGSSLRRSYLAFGPVTETSVDTEGDFLSSDYGPTEWAAFEESLIEPLTVAGIDDIFPIRVSFVANGVVGPNITAYRDATGVITRPKASFRRSRMNQR